MISGWLTVSLSAALMVCGCTSLGAHRAATSIAASDSTSELSHTTGYTTHPEARGLRGSGADAILARALHASCRGAGLTLDGRLAELALAIAEASDGARTPPSYAEVTYHARRTGLAEPTPQVWLARGPSTSALANPLAQAVREASATSRLTHCGAAAVPLGDGAVVALVLSARPFMLCESVPRELAAGAGIPLVGELDEGYRRPMVALTHPSGQVTRHVLGYDRDFSFRIPTPQTGTYTVELLADGPEGLTVAGMFPISVGVPYDTTPPPADPDPAEEDPSAVAERLLALIAEERARRNLPPLKIDARLARIAMSHSEDMVSHGFIAHSSKRTGDATARVRHAGLRASVVLENIGRGYSASELHRGLMDSPGHRGNILHPEAREIGIGVVAEREGDRFAFIATELFTQLATPRERLSSR